MLEKVERSAARLEGGFETVAFALPSARRLPCFNPALEPAGDTEAVGTGARHVAQRIERFPGCPAQAAVVPCGLLHECGARSLDRLRDRHPRRSILPLIEKNFDAAVRFVLFRFPTFRRGGATAAQAAQDTFDMLAGPQAVGTMVPAPARVHIRAQRTNLHRVAAAARRRDPVIAEGVRTLVERVHLDNLGSAAPLPAPDLVRIRRDPSPKRRRSIVLQAPASGRGFPSRLVHVELRTGVCAGHRASACPGIVQLTRDKVNLALERRVERQCSCGCPTFTVRATSCHFLR